MIRGLLIPLLICLLFWYIVAMMYASHQKYVNAGFTKYEFQDDEESITRVLRLYGDVE